MFRHIKTDTWDSLSLLVPPQEALALPINQDEQRRSPRIGI